MNDPPDELPAELFVTPPTEFVAARNRIAKELKGAGRSDLAARVAKLRRPSVTHWALNAAARSEPEVAAAWADSAEVARAAQEAGVPADMREALTALRAATAALVKVAGRHAPVGDVSIALAELASSPEQAEALRAGLLGADPNDVPAPSGARRRAVAKRPARKSAADDTARRRAVDKARAKVDAAKTALADADAAVESADDAAIAAAAQLDAARRAVADAEASVAAADRRRDSARRTQASAADRLERARTVLADAERAADEA